MAKRAADVCLSIWERRRLRWLAGLSGAAVVMVALLLGPSAASPSSCSGAPVAITQGALDDARGVAGGTLTTSNGVWSTSYCPPDGYDYQWFRDGTTSVGGDFQTYSPVGADVDHTLTVELRGCNGYGCSPWYSDSNNST